MKHLMTVCLVFLCSALAAISQVEAPAQQVRATISGLPADGPWVGQKVTLVIELLAPGYFSGASQFDFPEIPGVILVPPLDQPVLGTEEIGGQRYTSQRYEVLLYAQRPGTVEIPSFNIRFDFKTTPLDPTTQTQEVTTPELNFAAKLPPGAEQLGAFICSPSLTATENWNPEPKACKVGDAFTRTIQFQASDVPGIALPLFPTEKIPGLAIYRKSPVVENHSERGVLSGTRTEKITYVCEEPGHFVIPAITMTWFNLETQSLEKIELPQRELTVAVNPNMPTVQVHEQSEGPLGTTMRSGLFLCLSIGVFALAGVFFLARKWLSQAFNFLRPCHLTPLNPPDPSQLP